MQSVGVDSVEEPPDIKFTPLITSTSIYPGSLTHNLFVESVEQVFPAGQLAQLLTCLIFGPLIQTQRFEGQSTSVFLVLHIATTY